MIRTFASDMQSSCSLNRSHWCCAATLKNQDFRVKIPISRGCDTTVQWLHEHVLLGVRAMVKCPPWGMDTWWIWWFHKVPMGPWLPQNPMVFCSVLYRFPNEEFALSRYPSFSGKSNFCWRHAHFLEVSAQLYPMLGVRYQTECNLMHSRNVVLPIFTKPNNMI